jgi:hypothetical protein
MKQLCHRKLWSSGGLESNGTEDSDELGLALREVI